MYQPTHTHQQKKWNELGHLSQQSKLPPSPQASQYGWFWIAGCLAMIELEVGPLTVVLIFRLPRFFEDWLFWGGATRAWIFCRERVKNKLVFVQTKQSVHYTERMFYLYSFSQIYSQYDCLGMFNHTHSEQRVSYCNAKAYKNVQWSLNSCFLWEILVNNHYCTKVGPLSFKRAKGPQFDSLRCT